MHLARVEDIETLCKLRKYDLEGVRNALVHCYAYWRGIYIRDIDILENDVKEFNNSFKSPLKDTEVNTILRSVTKAIDRFINYEQGLRRGEVKRVSKGMRDKQGYWYKNETLIEMLEITGVEQRHLKTIIGIKEKYRRKNNKRNEARRNENGLTTKQQELQDLKMQVLELRENGLNNSEVARELNIDRKKVSRLINSI